MGLLKWIAFAVVPIAIWIYVTCFMSEDATPPEMVEQWWGKTAKPDGKEDTTVRPFVVTTSVETLKDLQDRLKNTRLPTSLEGTHFEYGFRSDYLKHVVEYWRTKYDWEKFQAQLNSLPQFVTKIDGIDVHFVRVVPSSNVGKKRAIMLIHGWPGSYWEFYKTIPMITKTKMENKNDDEDLTEFEVICPSIPGYGFSEAPHKPGFNIISAAQIFHKLMLRLGHEKFYLHGGDWGSFISSVMARAYPSSVIGVHLTSAPLPLKSLSTVAKLWIGEYLPSLIYTPEEIAIKVPLKTLFIDTLKESGYLHIQATKPDTVAASLTDSPAGLAAYILEKFSSWSNFENRNCSDGCITKYFTLDELLTNVMIYWVSGNVGSSMRFYKETLASSELEKWEIVPIYVPTGIAAFPHEVLPIIQSLTTLYYRNIIHFNYMPRGGHFAAFEEPQLMAKDIKAFVKAVEKVIQKSSQ